MNMKQFILSMGLYTEEEVGSLEFNDFYAYCWRHRPNDYNPAAYVARISDITEYSPRRPPSYNSIKSPIQRLVHMLITLSIKARHSAREKVTVDDLFLLEGMDGGNFIDVPWFMAKFFFDGAKGAQSKSRIQGAHLIGRLARNLGLMTPEKLAFVTSSRNTTFCFGKGEHQTRNTTLIGLSKLIEYNICRPNGVGGADLMPEGAGTGMMDMRNYVDDMALGIFGLNDQFDGFHSYLRKCRLSSSVTFSGMPTV